MRLLLIQQWMLFCSVHVSSSYNASSLCVVLLSGEVDERVQQQLSTLLSDNKDVHIIHSHEYFTNVQIRAILPLFPKLHSWYSDQCLWFLFISNDIELYNTDLLLSTLDYYNNPNDNIYFLGHSLQDTVPTITHHFHKANTIQYPLLCSGFCLSKMAVTSPISPSLPDYFDRVVSHYEKYLPDFTIDPVFELAIFLKYMRFPTFNDLHGGDISQHKDGVVMTHINSFCAAKSHDDDCSTYCSITHTTCTKPVLSSADVVFAVKTCQKYHEVRLPVVWNTWAGNPSPYNIHYYSDVTDNDYNTIETGVRNTERGHCSKFLAILHKVKRSINSFSWLVVCDDDTLISVSRLLQYVSCYDHNKPLIIGEMYGYKARSNNSGYLYPTGGSGIVFSKRAVEIIVQSGIQCPSDEYADDMFIGLISTFRLQIKLIHSSLYHQDQPYSYHPTVLQSSLPPISFHRYSPYDPISIYNNYLKDNLISDTNRKIEL